MTELQRPNRQELIQQLQHTAQQLESLAATLQDSGSEDPSPALSQWAAQAELLCQAYPDPLETLEMTAEDRQGLDRLLPPYPALQNLWQGALKLLRRLLPSGVNAKLSDWGLTALVSGVIILSLLAGVVWVSSTPSAGVIAEAPEPANEVSVVPVAPEESAAPLPPVLEAPREPQRVELEPPPEAPLTPEQSLLAFVQQEVTDLTQAYPPDLIVRVEPDLDRRRLTLILKEDWLNLPTGKQTALANTLWQRAQRLTFTQLRLETPQGKLLARNPVVGEEMILWATPPMSLE
ncbi:MAG: hypothetical protein VKN60_08175 [Cyanobacteriota bacterium]|nr:hypothetical protein [Cyanobacteriota bacterium]